MEYVAPLLLQYAVSSPLFVVWIVGIVLSALRLREDPQRFWLVLIALVLVLVLNVAMQAVSLVLPLNLERGGVTPAQLGAVMGWVNLVSTLLQAGVWAMLLVALFRGSTRRA